MVSLTLWADVDGVVRDGAHRVVAVEARRALLTCGLSHLVLVEARTTQLVHAGSHRTHVPSRALVGAGITDSLPGRTVVA
jgi:hypothetical protein